MLYNLIGIVLDFNLSFVIKSYLIKGIVSTDSVLLGNTVVISFIMYEPIIYVNYLMNVLILVLLPIIHFKVK